MITVVHRHKCVMTEQKPNSGGEIMCPHWPSLMSYVHVCICCGELLATNIQSGNKVSCNGRSKSSKLVPQCGEAIVSPNYGARGPLDLSQGKAGIGPYSNGRGN